jgi:hypothetical protein
MAKAATVLIGSLAVIATLCVYWTRTPQYALLHVLENHGDPTQERTTAHTVKQDMGRQNPWLEHRTQPVMRYLAHLQNKMLEYIYGARMADARIEGSKAVLTVTLSKTVYSIPFYEEPNGRWRLVKFENQARLLREMSERKTHSLVSLVAQL